MLLHCTLTGGLFSGTFYSITHERSISRTVQLMPCSYTFRFLSTDSNDSNNFKRLKMDKMPNFSRRLFSASLSRHFVG